MTQIEAFLFFLVETISLIEFVNHTERGGRGRQTYEFYVCQRNNKKDVKAIKDSSQIRILGQNELFAQRDN